MCVPLLQCTKLNYFIWKELWTRCLISENVFCFIQLSVLIMIKTLFVLQNNFEVDECLHFMQSARLSFWLSNFFHGLLYQHLTGQICHSDDNSCLDSNSLVLVPPVLKSSPHFLCKWCSAPVQNCSPWDRLSPIFVTNGEKKISKALMLI